MILGTDISHYEDNPLTPQKINFVKMKAAGAWFCIFKATQALYTDSVFKSSWADCKGLMPRGAYHYLDWTKPGLEQAKYFCNAIAADPPELPPVVDYECRTNIPPDANGQLWNFVSYVEAVTKRAPIIYTGPDYWKNYGSGNVGWKKFPLWIANYQVTKPYVPAPWTDWTFWQFTDRGQGNIYGAEALGIDLNYYNGTIEQLQALCGVVPSALPKTLEERVTALEVAARKAGWIL